MKLVSNKLLTIFLTIILLIVLVFITLENNLLSVIIINTTKLERRDEIISILCYAFIRIQFII